MFAYVITMPLINGGSSFYGLAMSAKKILISLNSSWNFVNFRSGLLRALVAEGYEVVAASPVDDATSALADLGCRHVPLPLDRRGRSVMGEARLLAYFRSLFRAERPDVHLSFTIKPNLYGSLASRSCGIPTIANVAGLGTTFLRRDLLNLFVRKLYARALRPSAITFFQNPTDLSLFVREGIVLPDRARLLPGSGVDLDRFSPTAVPASLDRSAVVFLLVARLLWAKGIGEYVEVARRVRSRHPHVRFHILGIRETAKGSISDDQMSEWVRQGDVVQLAQTKDVRRHLAASDCLVLPTFYPEGTPRSLLEGAAMARPLIATNVPGCRDVVQDGRNGFLCEPRDAASLEQAMLAFLSLSPEQRRKMGEASRQIAQERFDEQIVIERYLRAIRETIEPPDY